MKELTLFNQDNELVTIKEIAEILKVSEKHVRTIKINLGKNSDLPKTNLEKELFTIENKNGIETVNARELHRFLEVKTTFNDWFSQRVVRYEFKGGIDYMSLTEKIVSG